jgi:hypothetical protein
MCFETAVGYASSVSRKRLTGWKPIPRGKHYGERPAFQHLQTRSYATVVVPADGDYGFETDSARKVYLTEPIDATPLAMRFLLSFASGMLATTIGAGLVFVGLVLAARKGNGTDKEMTLNHENEYVSDMTCGNSYAKGWKVIWANFGVLMAITLVMWLIAASGECV